MATSPNYPKHTFELRIVLIPKSAPDAEDLKERVGAWLHGQGVTSFVEGTIDDVDIDNEPGGPQRDFYGELGGNRQPLSVFKYSRETLDELNGLIIRAFPGEIETSIHAMETETWMEGWKESFKPIRTKLFYLYPPWEKDGIPKDSIPLEIEPGMAFGTGQHATTQLCLRGIEEVYLANQKWFKDAEIFDVGTGTGILAIACRRLGSGSVAGTDIDPDALIAARANALVNKTPDIEFELGSAPEGKMADFVIANILAWVLRELMEPLAKAVRPGGLLMLSGLLVDDEEDLKRCAIAQGLHYSNSFAQDGWSCLIMCKPQRLMA